MSAHVIDPNYNWKQAASQEGVDYDAVKKAFMDQAYGFVANKAKVLFQDPFRLGFEIVHRNEKATKMVGIFAFRCNRELLYAPVFFVNGEIKSADMLYRNDVKRFVPLTDKWCSYLVRGANKESGELEDRSRPRQQDARMDRLAYPQRIKYAGQENILGELLAHCAEDTPLRKLLPSLIDSEGPEVLTKLAALIEDSELAQRFVSENYTAEELSSVATWQEKRANAEVFLYEDAEENSITLLLDPALSKSAAERNSVVDKGYALIDKRPKGTVNTVIEELENNSIYELNTPGYVSLMKADGTNVSALLLKDSDELLGDTNGIRYTGSSSSHRRDVVYLLDEKQIKTSYETLLFGNDLTDEACPKVEAIAPNEATAGKVYIAADLVVMVCSSPFVVRKVSKDGEASVITIGGSYGSDRDVFFAPGRVNKSQDGYLGDDIVFLEVEADVAKSNGGNFENIKPKWEHALISAEGIDKWIRTAGGIAESVDVTVKKDKATDLFSVTSRGPSGFLKQASDLGMLEAHLKLANDFEISCDAAGNILDSAIDDSVTRRIYNTLDKSAFVTRAEPMQQWIEGYDSELGVKLDAPQRQVLLTHTPKRQQQVPRYGDHWDNGFTGHRDPEEDGLPDNALMTKSPEELARLSAEYNLPHIFDHGALSQMATSLFNTVSQIQQYIPDLESGVDRYFRILFLLRYRPADFEEAYGKDELMEMEQELSELANLSGENLLRMLKRFDPNKFTTQGS